jgi:hypothetical protein
MHFHLAMPSHYCCMRADVQIDEMGATKRLAQVKGGGAGDEKDDCITEGRIVLLMLLLRRPMQIIHVGKRGRALKVVLLLLHASTTHCKSVPHNFISNRPLIVHVTCRVFNDLIDDFTKSDFKSFWDDFEIFKIMLKFGDLI